MARNEPSNQDLHCLPFLLFFFFCLFVLFVFVFIVFWCVFFSLKPLFVSVDISIFNDGRVHLRKSGMKELKVECMIL